MCVHVCLCMCVCPCGECGVRRKQDSKNTEGETDRDSRCLEQETGELRRETESTSGEKAGRGEGDEDG